MRIRKARCWAPLVAAGIAGLVGVSTSSAAIISAAAGPYTQSFDSLPVVAASPNTAPWVQGTTIPGWSLYAVTSGDTGGGVVSDIPTITTSAGGATTGALYNYGMSSSDTDRSLGSLCQDAFPGAQVSGDAKPSFYYVAEFVNDTGSDLSSINVGYTGEEWHAANTTAQTLTFQTFVGNSPDFSRAPGFGGWSSDTANTALTFTSPIASTAGTLNGHLAANSQVIAPVNVPLAVPAGSDFFIRWRDTNDSGLDDGLAINNVSVAFNVPEPTLLAPAMLLGFLARRRKV